MLKNTTFHTYSVTCKYINYFSFFRESKKDQSVQNLTDRLEKFSFTLYFQIL
jgi:hypothetical protein